MKIACCLLAAAFAQTTLAQQLKSWLAWIDWLLLVTIYVSLLRDPILALLTGTAAGILHDASSSGVAIGVSGLAKVLAAYVTYQISSMIVLEHFGVRLLLVAAGSIVNSFIYLAFYWMLKFDLPPQLIGARGVLMTMFFGVAINLIVSLPLFPLLDRIFRSGISRRLRRSEAMRGVKRR